MTKILGIGPNFTDCINYTGCFTEDNGKILGLNGDNPVELGLISQSEQLVNSGIIHYFDKPTTGDDGSAAITVSELAFPFVGWLFEQAVNENFINPPVYVKDSNNDKFLVYVTRSTFSTENVIKLSQAQPTIAKPTKRKKIVAIQNVEINRESPIIKSIFIVQDGYKFFAYYPVIGKSYEISLQKITLGILSKEIFPLREQVDFKDNLIVLTIEDNFVELLQIKRKKYQRLFGNLLTRILETDLDLDKIKNEINEEKEKEVEEIHKNNFTDF